MNTWLLEQYLEDPDRSDEELVAAWLEREFGEPQPQEAVEVLLEADDIVDRGIQWGGGVPPRSAFSSPHTTRLYWFFDGFIDQEFPYKMAEPTRETIEGLIEMKHEACERASRAVEKIKAAEEAMDPALYRELLSEYTRLADTVLLYRDWHSYILTLYAIERDVYPADRQHLAQMSRYAERFIRNLHRMDTTPGKQAPASVQFPDVFPIT
jgi:hypothetical protein